MKNETSMSAAVVTASPLTIKTPGAATAVNADKVSGLSLTAGDWVTITVRTPRRPLVTAIETEA